MLAPYAELHCLTNFSFLRGASHPEELVDRALALGYTGLAITDECSFAGSVRAHLELKEQRDGDELARAFRLIHGTEIQLTEGEGRRASSGAKLVLLATTRAGARTSRRTAGGSTTCWRCWYRCVRGVSRSMPAASRTRRAGSPT
jgi:error-prone DNA polymerase